MILSLFNHFAALVPLMLSPLLDHLIPLWKSTIALTAMPHLVSEMNFPKNFANLSMRWRVPVTVVSPSLTSSLASTSLSPLSAHCDTLILCALEIFLLTYLLTYLLSLWINPSLFHCKLKTPSLHSLPHLLGRISRIFMTISGLYYLTFFCFSPFIFFCLIRVIAMGQILRMIDRVPTLL